MANAKFAPILRHIRHLIGAGLGGLTDGDLLDRFVAERDGAAVAELIRRHGALVLGVCRRVLADLHAAEDVFQATFLILVRKAATLDRQRPLGAWLYTVAYRLALTARADAARRRRRECQAALLHPEAAAAEKPNELCQVIEEELQRLPERYRAPLVLCYLEGRTNEEAAEALGWPRGSISRRMAEARDQLRERLRCRGYLRPAAVGAVLATAAQAARAVPVPLLDTTVRAAVWFAAEPGTTAGFLSLTAVRLARKGLHTMAIQKIKIASALLFAVGLIAGGGALLVQSVVGAPAVEAASPAPRPDERPPASAGLPVDALARLGSTQFRHGDAIHFLRFTPDGRWLVTAGKDETVRMWELATGAEVRRFERPEPPKEEANKLEDPAGPGPGMAMRGRALALAHVFRVALSNDGKLLAAVRGNAAYIWDVASGKLLQTFREEKPAAGRGLADLTFTPNSKTLVTMAGDRTVCFWDLATGKATRQIEGAGPGGVIIKKVGGGAALAPGGRYLAWEDYSIESQSSALKIVDLTTGKPLADAKLPVDGARGLTFAPDGKTLAWTSFDNGIRIWDCTAVNEPRTINPEAIGKIEAAETLSLVFAADGKTVAACRSDGTVRLWDVAGGKQVCQLGTAPERPPSNTRIVVKFAGGALSASPVELAFAPDGKTVAACLGGPVIHRFDASTGKEINPPTAGHGGAVNDVRVSPDGKTLTTYAAHDGAHVWDLATGREVGRLPGNFVHVAIAADGRHLASSAGGTVTLWDPVAAREVGKIEPGSQGVGTLALSADGKTVATRGQRGSEVYLWDAGTGRALHTLTATAPEDTGGATKVVISNDINGVLAQELVFSPDGRFLAGAGPRRQLCLWDVATGNVVWEQALAADQVVDCFTFAASGRAIAALNHDGTVSLYETATGEARCRLGRPSGSRTPPAAIMLGGSPVMVSGLGQQATPFAVASSPNGRLLATAYDETMIHLWDVVTGEEVGQFKGHQGGIVSLAFSADGERLISGSLDTTALVWNVGKRAAAAPADALPAKDVEGCWADLAAADASRAFTAQRELCRRPAQAAALVKARVRPASGADAERIGRLVNDLDSAEFVTRQKATAALEELGEQARPALEKALAGDASLEVRQRLERVLQKMSGRPSGDRLRELRAVETLELTGGVEARRVLETLAGGSPEARLTREARAAVQRLGR